MRDSDLAAAWAAVAACGRDDGSLRARLRWSAELLRGRPPLGPGWWLLTPALHRPITGELLVGSGADCNLVLAGKLIGPRHARFLSAAELSLDPIDANFPTWRNGARVTRRIIVDSGDVLQFGDARVAVVRGGI